MKKLIVFLVLTAALVGAATKTELRESLVASGDYLEVGPLVGANSPFGPTVAKYTIALLIESSTDTLVAFTTQTYLWVLDNGGPSEQAFFNRNNLVNPPIPALSFYQRVINKMVNLSIDGYIIDTGERGSVEWPRVVKYNSSSDSTVTAQSLWVTRTDETAWSLKAVD